MVTRIPLTRGLVALVDDEDGPAALAAGPWSAFRGRHRTFYARRTLHLGTVDGIKRGTSLYLHRLLVPWPRIDHVNGDGLDCRRANLRPATHAQNMHNARRRVDNTSGYKGVSGTRWGWIASLHAEGQRHYLGTFPTPELAASAYDTAARERFGEFARLNFPAVRDA